MSVSSDGKIFETHTSLSVRVYVLKLGLEETHFFIKKNKIVFNLGKCVVDIFLEDFKNGYQTKSRVQVACAEIGLLKIGIGPGPILAQFGGLFSGLKSQLEQLKTGQNSMFQSWVPLSLLNLCGLCGGDQIENNLSFNSLSKLRVSRLWSCVFCSNIKCHHLSP